METMVRSSEPLALIVAFSAGAEESAAGRRFSDLPFTAEKR